MANLGKTIEVDDKSFSYNEKMRRYVMRLPPGSEGGGKYGSQADAVKGAALPGLAPRDFGYRGPQLTPDQYFLIVDGAYRRLLDSTVTAVRECGITPGDVDAILDTAGKLTAQYVISIQKGLVTLPPAVEPTTVEIMVDGQPADAPREETFPAGGRIPQIVAESCRRIREKMEGGKLKAEVAHALADAVRQSNKLKPEEKKQIVMFIVQAQLSKAPEVE